MSLENYCTLELTINDIECLASYDARVDLLTVRKHDTALKPLKMKKLYQGNGFEEFCSADGLFNRYGMFYDEEEGYVEHDYTITILDLIQDRQLMIDAILKFITTHHAEFFE
jgi:hypothetical protein